jgi:hypothetical protein
MVLLWLAFLWAGVTAGLGFLLQHYFVPTAVVATLLSGLAIGWAAEAAISFIKAALRRRPQPEGQPASPLRA